MSSTAVNPTPTGQAPEVAPEHNAPALSAQSGRRGLRSRVVLTGLLVLFVLVVGGFWYGYYRLVHYERRAALHVPPQAAFAARVDLEQVVLFEPFRRYVLGTAQQRLSEPSAWQDLQQRTGIRLAMDLREVLYASAPQAEHWLLAIGGLFPESGVLEGLTQWLQAQGQRDCLLQDQVLHCASRGLYVLRADDGVFLVGQDLRTLQAARAPNPRGEALGLQPSVTALEFALDRELLRGVAANPLLSQLPAVGNIARVTGRAVLAGENETRVEVRVSPTPGVSAEQLAQEVKGLVSATQLALAFAGPDKAGERTWLATAQISTEQRPEGSAVLLSSAWSRNDLDLAAQALGDGLWAWSQTGSAAAPAPSAP